MAFDLYSTHDLLGVLDNNGPEETRYFLDTFFQAEYTSTSENIDFDELDKERRLAPFVSPLVQGQPMLIRGYQTRSFKPAYLKPKNALDPAANFRRRAGERYGGEMTPKEREDAIIAQTLLMQRESCIRRWEWMAAQAAQFARVTVEGENYPTQIVDFGRDPGNTVTLTGGAQWSQSATAKPLDDITTWARRIQRSGRKARRLTMGLQASAAFFATEQVKAEFETRRGTSFGAQIERNQLLGDSLTYLGSTPDGIELYCYHDFYHDNDGTEVPYMAENAVLLSGDIQGVRAFGAIIDNKSNYQALPIFPKMWESEDPSGIFLMTQSAPLMVPLNPNASVYATVMPLA